jgi:glycosyltransferase involved in cell wall biosynthesis
MPHADFGWSRETVVGEHAMSGTRVALFMRRARRGGNFSVEHIVDTITECLGPEFVPVRAVSRFESGGILRRCYNVVEAVFRQGDVNHVTGDVHFLTYLLRKDITVLTVLDCGVISGAPSWRKRIIKLLWFAIPVRRCAAITVISHAVKSELLSHARVDADKVHVVPVAVPSIYRAVPKPFNLARPTLLQIGTAANKNLPRLAEALHGLPCRLRIVGQLTAAQLEVLGRFAIDYENCKNLSNEKLFAQYCEADIITFASTFEGFGMPIIEGNIVGRPVVTGNVASMPEVAGDAACLVDPFDVASIRAGILRVMQDASYREALVRKGFDNARRYDRATMTRQYEAIYRQLAAGERQTV